MKYFLGSLLIIHGLIHLIGFAKAFDFANHIPFNKNISKPVGVLWLVGSVLFITACILFMLNKDLWWAIVLPGIFVSLALIISYWQAARFGVVLNVVFFLVAVTAWAEWRLENQFHKDVAANLEDSNIYNRPFLTLDAISQLPEPVQKYIIGSGALNKPIPTNFKIKFLGRIRSDEKSDWIPFTSEQFNQIDSPTRLFFMKARMKGVPISGYHIYKEGTATMEIRLLSMFRVQYQSGAIMNISETVTWFNDLCLFAPAALIDKRIRWQHIDATTCRAYFSSEGITVSATLFFNQEGMLINFVSHDRFRIAGDSAPQQVPFLTPVKRFTQLNDHTVTGYAEATWQLPQGNLCYGQFTTKEIQYNVKK